MTESDMTGSKLVFIDIDGTLADENHIVPESAKTACARAQANGHKLFICTGRSVPKIERNILDLGFDGVVSVAGAQANIGDKLLFQHLVSPEAIDAAMAYLPNTISRATSGRVRTACTFPKVIAAIWSPRARRGIVVSLRGSGICWTR